MNEKVIHERFAAGYPPSVVWAEVFVAALADGGLRDVVISPGSRNTPLALAFYAHPNIQTYVQLDERSAGFFALGLAMAKGKPVALLCTSGTAGANYMPAVIEAKMSEVPLLVLTADRPHELRHSGANQTIDQVKLFGDQVLWAVDMALPETNAPPVAWRNLRRTAVRALAVAGGIRMGPVHLNFPFRQPLEPTNTETWPATNISAEQQPSISIQRGELLPTASQVSWLAGLVAARPQGLIVAGPLHASQEFISAVTWLAARTGFPILADALSGLRFAAWDDDAAVICGEYEAFIHRSLSLPPPQLILRFGSMPVSKRLGAYLARWPEATQIHIRESGVWADEGHVVDHFIQADPAALCRLVAEQLEMDVRLSWSNQWRELENTARAETARLWERRPFDAAYVAAMLDILPPEMTVMAGNSLPVRHVDEFGPALSKPLHIFGNRGASGIDGNISTGMGLAASTGQPVVLLVGDITLYHDSNGLLAARHLGLNNVTIVLFNNNGGGIFQRLPVAQFDPPFEELFRTRHDLDFASLAKTYGFAYQLVEDLPAFAHALGQSISTAGPSLIEIRTDPVDDLAQRQQFEDRLWAAINRN